MASGDHIESGQLLGRNHTQEYEPGCYENTWTGLGRLFGLCGMLPGCCCCQPYKSVDQGSVGLVTRFGRYERRAEPGLVYINPFTEQLQMVDTRLIVLDLARQNVITADNLSLNVDCVLGYRITDPNKAKFSVKDVQYALTQFTYTTLRHICGNKSLQECLASRDHIASDVKDLVKKYAQDLGVQIETIGFRDMIIPTGVSDAIASAAIARRTAESKLISAEADVAAAKLMAQAAEALDTKAGMQIRLLKTMEDMSKQQGPGSRIFVIPTEMTGFGSKMVQQQMADSQ
jgi:erythrocyte band 7 integral membrane protein